MSFTFENRLVFDAEVDKRISYDREYIIIDKNKILQCISNPSQLLTILNDYETKQFIKQIRESDHIDDIEEQSILNDYSKIFNISMLVIQELLQKQYTYVTKIPNIQDLENNGLFDSIIKVIQNHPDLTIDNQLVIDYTNQHLLNLLSVNHFISFKNIELVLNNLKDTNIILGPQLIELLNRTSPYLSFITSSKITSVEQQLQNSENLILDIFTQNELKMVVDKEIELKMYLLKVLTPDEITKLFEQFKNELITINITQMVDSQFNILKTELLANDYTSLVSTQVDAYLTASYNTLMSTTINKAFTSFKNDFINIDLRSIIKNYFDELSVDDNVIRAQINNYLDSINLTDGQVQSWIKQYI